MLAETFLQFLRNHRIRVVQEDTHSTSTINCYREHLRRIVNRQTYEYSPHTFVVEVPLDELVDWDGIRGQELADKAQANALRYHDLMGSVLDRHLESLRGDENDDVLDRRDLLEAHRREQQRARETQQQQNNNHNEIHAPPENEDTVRRPTRSDATEELPSQLLRRYELRLLPLGRKGSYPPFDRQDRNDDDSNKDAPSLRSLRAQQLGHLVTLQGMVVRASDVQPCCTVATYTCDRCGAELYQDVSHQREFVPLRTCVSDSCKDSKAETLHGGKCRFVSFQELKIQELPSQVPMGHVPRSLTVHCRGHLTRQASPGTQVTIDGIFLPQRVAESGYRALKAGLVSLQYVHAQNVVVHQKSYDEATTLSPSEQEALDLEVWQVQQSDDPVAKLAHSIAPEIFGHEDIKRALLLQLVGGCTRALQDGLKIRGDINICLMGDPGVAKSQLLKHVASIAPRGVYTTGKGSSGVGLTAAVTKDMATGEMSLEGGALVLADQGICCIDEFDKMDENDRTAIHEVMEQQTVSIAKAGIVATLNARASVLAAANPLYGRYNRSKSLSENINLPNSLLSRFDLMFLVLDIPDVDRDMALARHVTLVHQTEGVDASEKDEEMEDDPLSTTATPAAFQPISPKALREYISRARTHKPVVPKEVSPYIVEAYVSLRNRDRTGAKRKRNDQTVMTARQLLSILRLSQALARLRFSDEVAREDVDEAIRLTHMSKASLEDEEGRAAYRKGDDVMSRIFSAIRDYVNVSGSHSIEMKVAEAMVLRKGFTEQQFLSCLEEYTSLDVLEINASRTHITILDSQ